MNLRELIEENQLDGYMTYLVDHPDEKVITNPDPEDYPDEDFEGNDRNKMHSECKRYETGIWNVEDWDYLKERLKDMFPFYKIKRER